MRITARRAMAGLLGAAAVGLSAAATAATAGWFDSERPSEQARQAVHFLADAASDGLDPADYDGETLARAVARAAQGTPLPAHEVAALEEALTASMQRYLRDLHGGRIDPRDIHEHFAPPSGPTFDAAQVLRDAMEQQRLAEAVRSAAPRLLLYERLREALARYRAMSDLPWDPPLPAAGGRHSPVLRPGQPYAGVARLAHRLETFGDLAAGARVPALYDGAIVDAVRAFQRRHGLDADGVIGPATRKQLDVPPTARVRQIEVTMERLRWTPLLEGPRMIVVNIPEFVLRAYEVHDGRIAVRETMRVIVGKALDTRTPLFDEDMRFVEFSPYWNVPPSIARAEIVPRLRRDPGYLQREGFEFVSGGGAVDTSWSAAILDAVLAGRARIRQRPGPRNALGDIKFVFPNRDNIYLHHTPSPQLFARNRRDYSHGCIRVEQPVALARFVLHGMPGWPEERIREAMQKGESFTLRLDEPVPVLIAYGTTLVREGRIHFFDDIYGHDRLLDAALRKRAGSKSSTIARP